MLLSLLLLSCAQNTPSPNVIAVTQSGVHVEAVEAAVGDIEVATPFGRFLCASDPVSEVRALSSNLDQLYKFKELGVFSASEWLTTLSEGGYLSALVVETQTTAESFPELIIGYDLLEAWAQQIDVLPPNIDVEHQVAWLYKHYLKQNGLTRIFAASELIAALSPGTNRRVERNLSNTQLADELKSDDPIRRRTGLQACAKQSEINYLRQVLALSIVDTSAHARQTAAIVSAQLHQHSARQYWVKLAARGAEVHRSYAVSYLATLAGPIGKQALSLLASAIDRPIGDRYNADGHKVSIVKNYDLSIVRPVLWLDYSNDNDRDQRLPIDLEDSEFIDSRSALIVTKVPTLLAEQLRALL